MVWNTIYFTFGLLNAVLSEFLDWLAEVAHNVFDLVEVSILKGLKWSGDWNFELGEVGETGLWTGESFL